MDIYFNINCLYEIFLDFFKDVLIFSTAFVFLGDPMSGQGESGTSAHHESRLATWRSAFRTFSNIHLISF